MENIEDRLIARGVSKEDIDGFAKLPKHNEKKDIFRVIAGKEKLADFPKGLIENLMYVLAEKGIEDFPSLNSEKRKSQRNYLGEKRYNLFVSQYVAGEILGILDDPKMRQYDNSLTLNKLYQEAIK